MSREAVMSTKRPTRRQFIGGAAAGACGVLAGREALAELKPPDAVQDSYYAALREPFKALGIRPDDSDEWHFDGARAPSTARFVIEG
jgi:hypothetical protein